MEMTLSFSPELSKSQFVLLYLELPDGAIEIDESVFALIL